MESYWGERLTFIPALRPDASLVRRAVNKALRLIGWQQIRNQLLHGGLSGVDDKYTRYIDRRIGEYLRGKHFDAVFCIYVFYAKALRQLPAHTLKVLDTIDAHSLRDRKYRKNVFIIPAREEAKALDRADVVLAIQSKEAEYFRTLTGRKVILVGHRVAVFPPRVSRPQSRKILFVGSTYHSNVLAVTHFIENIFPLVQSTYPDAELVVAGRVCERIGSYPGCTKLGLVADLEPLYDGAALAINPIYVGRGLKIKNIEALGHAIPLVTTTVGAEGLEEGAGRAFWVGDTPEAFAGHILRLLSDEDVYTKTSREAFAFATRYNDQVYEPLREELGRRHLFT